MQKAITQLKLDHLKITVGGSGKSLGTAFFGTLTNKTNKQISILTLKVDFLDEAKEYWEEHFDDVVKDIKEYANSKVKKPIEDRESSNFFINTNGEN